MTIVQILIAAVWTDVSHHSLPEDATTQISIYVASGVSPSDLRIKP